jgi:hypothetical protein
MVGIRGALPDLPDVSNTPSSFLWLLTPRRLLPRLSLSHGAILEGMRVCAFALWAVTLGAAEPGEMAASTSVLHVAVSIRSGVI